MLKSHVLLLAEAYHFLAHWKEIVCMSSVLCVSSIDGMHTFPVWMQIHFHLFLGIVIIPHHTYSSTYTRTRPLPEWYGIRFELPEWHYGSFQVAPK